MVGLAIYHFSGKVISRATGRSAVASAAYRAAERLTNERDGLTHDFTRKEGVEHAEIVLPDGVAADWAKDRAALWNAAEFAEKRKDARVAREFQIALPHELTGEQRLDLCRDFARELSTRYGAAVDFAIHAPHEASDIRNHHAHVMMTTRTVTAEGLGEKTLLERENKWLLAQGLATTDVQIRDLRQAWEGVANEHLARAGLDVRIDHRSHLTRGLSIEPTEHMGVHATQMQRKGMEVSRGRLDEAASRRNAELIAEKPEQVLSLITAEKSVFDRRDIARALHRAIDDPEAFQTALASVMASPALVELQAERVDVETGEIRTARYSTREMVAIETGMVVSAERLSEARDHGVDRRQVERAIEHQDAAIRSSVAAGLSAKVASGELDAAERDRRVAGARLSDEQRRAIEHVTGPERIAVVVGFAGAGKSTMLAAAREAWEAQGYRVHGAALAGKAAEGLEESSGIASRTLASWERSWQNERHQLGRGDVLVIDEAGMVGSRQLARFVGEAEARGAKLVLVGDHEQLQAIGAGAPFRAIAETVGHAELSDIRRQREGWQREASVAFATHRTVEGLAAYRAAGAIRLAGDMAEARAEVVREYLADLDARPDGTRVAMAHRRADVRALNEEIRSALQERGELARVRPAGEVGDEASRSEAPERSRAFVYQTNGGKREFAEGDRIVFLENNRDLGVKNGMLGTVEAVEPGMLEVRLDGPARVGVGARTVSVSMDTYNAIDHGYATTIHKNQGATVDRAYVLASGTMDRHLTYVAMTRHREGVQLHVARDEFASRQAGVLVEHGKAPFEHDAANRASYFVTMETAAGARHTTWGVDLERAMAEAAPAIGDTIGLRHEGAVPVRLPDGTEAERNTWKVLGADELAWQRLEARLSRSGAKETTLDYREGGELAAERQFAERRGIAESFGIRSEIEVEREGVEPASLRAERVSTAEVPALARGSARTERADLAQDLRADPRKDLDADRQQRRSRFEGLKLPEQDRGAAAEAKPEKTVTARRGLFDGLKLGAGRGDSPERVEASPVHRPAREAGLSLSPHEAPPERDRLAERVRVPSAFEAAIDRYARAHSAADRQVREGLPLLEGQKQELAAAGQQLDQVRPGAQALMQSALQHDPEARRVVAELAGRDRVGQLVAGMERERAALADPGVRAERFVERWNQLKAERRTLTTGWHVEARQKVEAEMRGLARTLERDPQMESLLRNRRQDLGIDRSPRESAGLSHELEQSLTRGRSQNLGLGM